VSVMETGLPDEWPEEVRIALRAFRLGHLIADPPLVYARATGHRIWNPSSGASADRDEDVVEIARDRFPFGIITTQTCDLNEQAPYPKQPFLQVSPVYRYSADRSTLPELQRRGYLWPLTAPAFTGELWVADLRLECGIEKSVLVGRTPIDAFVGELDEIAFAERLGRRRDRAAMGNAVNDVLDAQMAKKISANKKKAKRVFESVHGLRLEVAEGLRLEPVAMRLHVLLRGDPDPGDAAIVEARDWFDAWWDRASAAGETNAPKLRLLPTRFHDAARVDVRIYDRLIPYDRRP
jgi:hypothetical protein